MTPSQPGLRKARTAATALAFVQIPVQAIVTETVVAAFAGMVAAGKLLTWRIALKFQPDTTTCAEAYDVFSADYPVEWRVCRFFYNKKHWV